MILSKPESDQFFKLYKPLLSHVSSEKIFESSKFNKIVDARNYLFSHLEVFDYFLRKNPIKFNNIELEIILGWKNKFVKDNFIFLKQQKKQAIFLISEEIKHKGFKVVGLTDSPMDLVGIDGVYLQDVILLPFHGKIIWDGLFFMGPILGVNYLWDYNELYKELKTEYKVISEL